MQRTTHFHVLDAGDGDWGAYQTRHDAIAAVTRITRETAEYFVDAMQPHELTIVSAEEWCSLDGARCYEDLNQEIQRSLTEVPRWTHQYRPQELSIYRIDGKRVPRWKMTSRLSVEQMATLWPFTYHPVALPQWRFDNMIVDPSVCQCATRGHRKKGCIIGPSGRKCSICGALFTEYGNALGYCPPCDDWKDLRERYLADTAAKAIPNASAVQQMALL